MQVLQSSWAGILGPPPTGSRPTSRQHYHKTWTKEWGQVRPARYRSLRAMSGQKPAASWLMTQMLMPAILGWRARSYASLAAIAV